MIAVLLALGRLLAPCGSADDPSVEGGADMMDPMDDEGIIDDGDMGDGHDESSDVADDARRIEVTATSFDFAPDEIRVHDTANLPIALTSADILHVFTI